MVLNRIGWSKTLMALLRNRKRNDNNEIIKRTCPDALHLNLNGCFRRNLDTECTNEEVKQPSGSDTCSTGSDPSANDPSGSDTGSGGGSRGGVPSDMDPIQRLFVEKIREYAEKSKAKFVFLMILR